MMKQPARSGGMYGARGNPHGLNSGIRCVAPTFGKTLIKTYSAKASGTLIVESDAERLVAHMLTLDPRVRTFQPQPFKADLIDGRILRTPEAVTEARAKHKHLTGAKFYTPDFLVEWHGEARSVLEVKLEGFAGDNDYQDKLRLAREVFEAGGYRFQPVVLPADPFHPLRGNLPLLTKAVLRQDLWPTDEQVQAIESACGGDPIALAALCLKLDASPNMVPVWLVSGVVQGDLWRNSINGRLSLTPACGDLGHLTMLAEICA